MTISEAQRAALIDDLSRLWLGWSEMRFGQMLRVAVGDSAVRQPASLDDAVVAECVARALREKAGRAPDVGPHWSTEADTGRTFLDGLPRDPARIPLLLDAVRNAWSKYPRLSLGQLIERALNHSGIPENEFNSRLLLTEDAAVRRAFVELS